MPEPQYRILPPPNQEKKNRKRKKDSVGVEAEWLLTSDRENTADHRFPTRPTPYMKSEKVSAVPSRSEKRPWSPDSSGNSRVIRFWPLGTTFIGNRRNPLSPIKLAIISPSTLLLLRALIWWYKIESIKTVFVIFYYFLLIYLNGLCFIAIIKIFFGHFYC